MRHTFGANNGTCNTDYVDDTPPTAHDGPPYQEDCHQDDYSCGVHTNYENYMDYTPLCNKMFTQGQVDRMTAYLNHPDRTNHWSAQNLINTGIGINIVTQPQSRQVCGGSDAIYTVEATGIDISYQWQYRDANSTSWFNFNGEISSVLSVHASTQDDGMAFRCVLSNPYGTDVISSAANLTIHTSSDVPPTIISQPRTISSCPYYTTTFSVEATGTNLTYQWQRSVDNGVSWLTIPGATSSSYVHETILSEQGYKYRCLVNNGCGGAISNEAEQIVYTDLTILSHPQSETVCTTGGSVSLIINATSGSTLSYQWEKSTNGGTTWTSIAGANAAIYSFEASSSDDGNRYRCIVSSSVCQEISNETLVILSTLVITSQPQLPPLVCPSTFSISIVTEGEGLSYLWQRKINSGVWTTHIPNNGTPDIVTGTFGANPGSTISYRCIVSNDCISVTSDVVSTQVVNSIPITITTHPQDIVNICENSTYSATFLVVSSGVSSYQWEMSLDGGDTWTSITGATSQTYSVVPSVALNQSKYRCILINSCGSTTSSIANLYIRHPATITIQPENQAIYPNTTATFGVGAMGDNLTYQWQQQISGMWMNILGANASTYAVTGTLAMNEQAYRCIVGNSCGNTFSNAALLYVGTSIPAITVQPHHVRAEPGTIAQFSVSAISSTRGSSRSGRGRNNVTLTYQWQRSIAGGVFEDVAGATGSSYSFTVEPTMYRDEYRCVISDGSVQVNSSRATLIFTQTVFPTNYVQGIDDSSTHASFWRGIMGRPRYAGEYKSHLNLGYKCTFRKLYGCDLYRRDV